MEPFTAALLAKLAAKILKPIYDGVEKELSQQAHLALHKVFNSYADYLQQATQKHSYFNSVVFKNEQRILAEYYQPLTIVNTRSKHELLVTGYPGDEVDRARNMLIVDTAGMGKTTLLKLMFLKCAEEGQAVPILIELRKLSKKKKLTDFLLDVLSGLDGSCKPDLFFKLLSKGGFCFFLDGYDEIPDIERAAVTASIQNFIEKAPHNAFIMTSRDEAGLSAFPQFQRYTIKPLFREEAYSLLRKYADPGLADSLIAKLDLPENQAIHEFLASPLLASLLFKSFEYKHIIPLKRHIFYRQVYEALYESHDLTKEGGEFQRSKKSGLDIDRFEQVLRGLGAVTYKATKTEFTKDAALDFAGKALALCSERKAAPSSITHDATHAVPLLVVDGNYIRWSHRSIQEYFAAQYLCKNTEGRHAQVLLDYYNGRDFSKHINLVLLAADIDRAAFDRSIGLHVAQTLLSEYKDIYRGIFPGVESAAVEQRRRLCVGRMPFIINSGCPQGGGNRENEWSRRIHERIINLSGGADLNSSRFTYGDPGVGFALTKIESFIESTMGRLDLPFIEVQENVSQVFDNKKGLWPDGEVVKIADDESSPLNSVALFGATTNLILCLGRVRWRFNPDLAVRYIEEIGLDSKNIADSQPW